MCSNMVAMSEKRCIPLCLLTVSIPGHVIPKTFKMVLDTSLLNTQQYKVRIEGGARGVMVIVVGNGHGDTSSNPGRD